MHRQSNLSKALASAGIPHTSDLPARALHPYTRALSRDALLDEIDDRLFSDGELHEVEELLNLMEQGHGLAPVSA